MKTKDLIKMLQEVDPSGECQVNGYGGDLWFAQRLPWYYDGNSVIVERKPNGVITGIRQGTKEDGDKVVIYELGIDEVMCDWWGTATAHGSPEFMKICEERRQYWKNEDQTFRESLGQ